MMRIDKDVYVTLDESAIDMLKEFRDMEAILLLECGIYGHDIHQEFNPGAPLICKRCGKWID